MTTLTTWHLTMKLLTTDHASSLDHFSGQWSDDHLSIDWQMTTEWLATGHFTRNLNVDHWLLTITLLLGQLTKWSVVKSPWPWSSDIWWSVHGVKCQVDGVWWIFTDHLLPLRHALYDSNNSWPLITLTTLTMILRFTSLTALTSCPLYSPQCDVKWSMWSVVNFPVLQLAKWIVISV
jgi:hypothetical protein